MVALARRSHTEPESAATVGALSTPGPERSMRAVPLIDIAERWAQRDSGEVAIELLDDVGTGVEADVITEAERLQRWPGDVRFRTRFPTPLEQRLRR